MAGMYAPPAVQNPSPPRSARSALPICGPGCRIFGRSPPDQETLRPARQERAAGVDQIETGQPVFVRDFLRAQMFFHRDRIVSAPFHRRIVGHDHAGAARYAADARHDAGAGSVVLVNSVSGQRRQLEEFRAGIDEPLDAFVHRHLALLPMALHVLRAAPLARFGDPHDAAL